MNNLVNNLFNLHLKVLQQILIGTNFPKIREMFSVEFKELDYEEIITKKAHRLTFDESGNLIGAYPVSPNPNQFKVSINGIGEGYAMCAVDALGIAYTFMKETIIETRDESTGNNLILKIDPNSELIDTQSSIVMSYPSQGYTSLKQLVAENTQLATSTCPNILFYSKDNIPDNVELSIMNFDDALKDAIAIFSQQAMKEHLRDSI